MPGPQKTCLLLLVGVAQVLAKNSYMFIAPKSVRPGMDYVLQGSILADDTAPVLVTASLKERSGEFKDDSIVSDGKLFAAGEDGLLTLKIPKQLPQKDYIIVVEGTGGLKFTDSENVDYSQKSSSILIQTDKAIYKPGQSVRFRILGITPDLKIVQSPIDIDVYDPKGNKIRQWRGVKDKSGVYEDMMLMSDEPVLGDWKMKVAMNNVKETKKFTVDEYVLPKFEVSVDLPSFALTTSSVFAGSVTAKYTYGKPVKGQLDLLIKMKDAGRMFREGKWTESRPIKRSIPINGEAKFTLDMKDIKELKTRIDRSWLIVEANVTESLTGLKMSDDGTVQFFSDPLKMEFPKSLPKVFKPGMKYTAFLKVSQQDGSPPVDVKHRVRVKIVFWVKKKKTPKPPTPRDGPVEDIMIERRPWIWPPPPPEEPDERKEFPLKFFDVPEDGVITIPVEVPDRTTKISIDAKFHNMTASPSDHLSLKKFHSPSDSFAQVSLMTDDPMAGKPATFLVRSTANAPVVFYQILSKGNVVDGGQLSFSGQLKKNLTINVTSDMAPKAKMIVYYVQPDGEVVADGLSFNVDGIFDNKVEIAFNKTVSKPGDEIELNLIADPGSKVNVLAVDKSVLLLKTGNDITGDQVQKELESYDPKETSSGVEDGWWFWRWPRPTKGDDTKDVFDNAGLAVLTDANVYEYRPPPKHRWHEPLFFADNMAIEAMPMMAVRRGPAPVVVSVPKPPPPKPKSGPAQRVRKLFPETWLWSTAETQKDGTVTIQETVPDTITSWVASAFAVHPKSGLGIADERAQLETFLPFFVSLQLPYSVIRGEQVIIQANLFNYGKLGRFCYIYIRYSDEFENVHVEPWGTYSYPSAVARYVWVPANGQTAVYFPIVPKVLGSIKIEIHALTAMSSDAIIRRLLVEAEGDPKEFNTPLLINLKPGQNFEERIPVSFPPNAVSGSQRVRATVIGDLMGPTMNNLDKLLKMPYGCGEQNMLNFAPNIYVTLYMQVTDNLNADIMEKAKKFMMKGYQRELNYQHTDGSFSAFGDRDPSGSMWLTAFVLKSFVQARPYIFVDDEVINKAVDWILKYQHNNGSFWEPGRVLHKEMQGGSTAGERSLTAFVLVALLEARKVQGIASKVESAAGRAMSLLEGDIPFLSDVYEVAIISYALHLGKSPAATPVLEKLKAMATIEDGEMYWAKNTSAPKKTTTKPWHNPKKGKALNIEITSYALLTLAVNKDVLDGIKVLKWLTGQRNPHGGFSSTQDTVMALQSLSEMASQVFSPDFDVTVTLQGPAGSSFSSVTEVNSTNALILHYIEIPSDIGTVIVRAEGNGLALVEVAGFYNVETDEEEKTFNLKTTIPFEDKNDFTVKVCTSWLGEGTTSMAVMEIGTISGFAADTESIKIEPPMKRVEDGNRKVIVYFDEIGPQEVCVDVQMQRIGLVAAAQPAVVKIYDYYEPSNVVTDFYVPLAMQNADVCDVCGKDCNFCERKGKVK